MSLPKLGRILIVDDEVELLTVLSEKLAKHGYEVAGFGAPREALRALEERSFDLLLTDMMMPEMDGLELLRRALQIDPHLAGIMMTGQATVQTAVDALKTGAYDYVLKPFKLGIILPVLARAMEARRLRMENLQLRETVAIYELARAVACTFDLQTLIHKIADAALQQCEADEVSLMLPTENEKELCVSVVRGENRGGILGERVPIDKGIAGWVARFHEPLLLNGQVADPRFEPVQPRPDICSAISMPMLVGGRLVGVLNVNALGRRHPFTRGQVKTLGLLASAGSAAMEGAILFEKVRQAEAKYRSIFENAAEGIMQCAPDWRVWAANPALARILGYESADELMNTVHDLSAQLCADPDRRGQWLRQLKETGSISEVETQALAKNGRKVWVSFSCQAVPNNHGILDCYEGTLHDISHRKRDQWRLTTENAVARVLTEAGSLNEFAPQLIQAVCTALGWEVGALWMVDPSGPVLHCQEFWSRASCPVPELESISRDQTLALGEDLPGRTWLAGKPVWVADVSQDEAIRRGHTAARSGLHSAFAFPIQGSGGTIGVLEFLSREMVQPNQELLDMFGAVGSQIGESIQRIRAEDALRASEQRFRNLVDAAPDVIAAISLDSRYTSLNPAFEVIHGWPSSDWIGQSFTDLVHPEDLPLARENYSLVLQGLKPPLLEVRARTRSGSYINAEITSTPQIQDGKVVGGLAISRNITDRKRLEAQYLQAQKMEAFGRLAGGVAHDFNNLLTVIAGYCELLLSKLPPADSSRNFIQEIQRSGERAAALTRQLLAFSRKQVLVPEVLDLNSVVAEIEKMLRRLIGEDIELQTNLSPRLRRTKADPGQLGQVIMNLAINARGAMPEGGKLVIRTANVDLSDLDLATNPDIRPGPYVLLDITDSGCGMSEETLAHIFEPFFTTKAPGKGTGLGLATVYGIVKQSGGHIEVSSVVDKGTTFRVYLPEAVEKPAPPRPRPNSVGTASPAVETILLVEDDTGVRTLARQTLKSKGYRVLEAGNGREALRLCEEHIGPIHLVISDVVMPGMSGRLLREQLAHLRPKLRVLFMSGYTDDALLRHVVIEDGMPFLQKPFTPDSLARKVAEVLEHNNQPG